MAGQAGEESDSVRDSELEGSRPQPRKIPSSSSAPRVLSIKIRTRQRREHQRKRKEKKAGKERPHFPPPEIDPETTKPEIVRKQKERDQQKALDRAKEKSRRRRLITIATSRRPDGRLKINPAPERAPL